jgi:hypothetical protein
MPPCGVPVRVSLKLCLSITPARRNFQRRSLMSLSATFFFTALIKQYFGHFLSEWVNKKGHSWLNVSAQRYLQPGNGL